MAIRMIIGLGNPGPEYANTRHNSGFRVVDELGQRLRATYWKKQCGALVARVRCDAAPDGELVLVKPQSYMNESGGPVKRLLAEYSLGLGEVLVVHDELDILAGDVRFKQGGGHGGHNGLRSIIDKIGNRDFARLRMGIGRPPGRMDPAAYVLAPLRKADAELFNDEIMRGTDAALFAVEHGIPRAMSEYNRKDA